MNKGRRVAFVSTAGPGHLNTLLFQYCDERDHGDPQKDAARLFVVSFCDEDVAHVPRDAVLITVNGKRPSEIAAVFNAARAKETQDALHVWLHDFAPAVVVYDFFVLKHVPCRACWACRPFVRFRRR